MKKNGIRTRERNKDFFWYIVGSYCRRCGYKEFIPSLQLHHIDKNEKTHRLDSLGYWLSLSRYKLVKKLAETKFTIFCANCHIKLHSVLLQRDVNINPIDNSIFKEMLKCMRPPAGITNKQFNQIDDSPENWEVGIHEMEEIEERLDNIEKCREERHEYGIDCEVSDCGLCGIKDMLGEK